MIWVYWGGGGNMCRAIFSAGEVRTPDKVQPHDCYRKLCTAEFLKEWNAVNVGLFDRVRMY